METAIIHGIPVSPYLHKICATRHVPIDSVLIQSAMRREQSLALSWCHVLHDFFLSARSRDRVSNHSVWRNQSAVGPARYSSKNSRPRRQAPHGRGRGGERDKEAREGEGWSEPTHLSVCPPPALLARHRPRTDCSSVLLRPLPLSAVRCPLSAVRCPLR